MRNSFHPLIRQGNTFEFITDANLPAKETNKTFYIPSHPGLSAGLTTLSLISTFSEKYYMGKSLFQLNLDNGEFY